MTRSASEIIESYLSRLRSELTAAGAEDTDDVVAEIRSLLTEAAGDDAQAAEAQTERLGEPAELARGILAERGLDPATGMASGTWWRLGIAAPVDIAIGLAVPLAAALPLYVVGWFGQPRAMSIAIAVVLGAVALAWPFFIWRPWRRGGRSLSPGMTLTGLAVVRAPGFWRLVRIEELRAMGLAPRRRVGTAVFVAIVAVDFGGSWLAAAAISAEFSGKTVGGGVPIDKQLESVITQVYVGLTGAPGPDFSSAQSYVSPEGSLNLQPLWARIAEKDIRTVRLQKPEQIKPGVYRVEVTELARGSNGEATVGSSTFIVGQRQWLRADGVGSDWVVVGIDVGVTPGSK
jgi:methionine-rich copper-binding protein CopC